MATNPLRVIAETELTTCFGELDPAVLNDLATSLVRQWVTNHGNAAIVTFAHNFWFRLTRDGGGYRVVRDVQEGDFVEHMRRSRVPEAEIPALLHQLTVRQSVQCYADYGEPLRLRVDPTGRTFHIEYAKLRDDWLEDE